MTKKVIHWMVLYHVVGLLRQHMTTDKDENSMKIVKPTEIIKHTMIGSVPVD